MKPEVVNAVHRTACAVGLFPYAGELCAQFCRWMEKTGVNGSFCVFPSKPADMDVFCSLLRDYGVCGVAFDPQDLKAFSFLDEAGPQALDSGLVDTVSIRPDGSMTGEFLHAAALRSAAGRPVSKAVLFGNSPLLRAVAKAKLAPEIVVVADESTAHLDYPPGTSFAGTKDYQKAASRTDLVLNSDPLADFSLNGFGPSAIVADFDVPLRDISAVSPMVRKARVRGHRIFSYWDFLLELNAQRFALWYGARP